MEYGHNSLNTQPGRNLGNPFQIENVNSAEQAPQDNQVPNPESNKEDRKEMGERGQKIFRLVFDNDGKITDGALEETLEAGQGDNIVDISNRISQIREAGRNNPGGRKAA